MKFSGGPVGAGEERWSIHKLWTTSTLHTLRCLHLQSWSTREHTYSNMAPSFHDLTLKLRLTIVHGTWDPSLNAVLRALDIHAYSGHNNCTLWMYSWTDTAS